MYYYTTYLLEWQKLERSHQVLGKLLSKTKFSITAGGKVKYHNPFGKQSESILKLNTDIPTGPSHSIPGYLSKRNENISYEDLFTNVHSSLTHDGPKWEVTHMSINK